MADTLRIKSTLPIAIHISEPHPDAARPGDSPVLKHAVLYPGVNENMDPDLFKAWSESNPSFIASPEDVKAGTTDGKVYPMTEDEPDQEFGFEPALKRATDAGKTEAAKGFGRTDPGPLKGEDMRTGSADMAPVPVLTAVGGASVRTPANDANLAQGKPAEKPSPPAK